MKITIPLSLYLISIIINSSSASSNKNNRKLSDIFDTNVDGATTGTIDRYYKTPPKRPVSFNDTSSGSSGYYTSSGVSDKKCVLNGAGIFGSSISSNNDDGGGMVIPLLFEYRLEFIPNDEDNLEGAIIPDLEQAIGEDLAIDMNVCSSNRRKRRDLQGDEVDGIMKGIGLLPVDQVNTDKICDTMNPSCAYINGEMTLYYIPTNSSSRDDINEIKQTSLNTIQNNMNSGKYNSDTVNPNIIGVAYIAITASSEEQLLTIIPNSIEANPEETTPPPPASSESSDSQKTSSYTYVIIASCAVLAVIAIIFVRRKKRSVMTHEFNDNDHTITKDVAPPDLEISVTEATSFSTLVSPSRFKSKA